jgi:hypothetical protein
MLHWRRGLDIKKTVDKSTPILWKSRFENGIFTCFSKFDVYADENSLGVWWDKYLDKLENLLILLDW